LYYFTEFNNRFFFVGSDATHGTELWVSDGTPAGTQLFADLYPGPDNSYPARFTVMNNNTMIFTANTTSGNDGLWITDGTPGGTQFITDPYPGSANGWAGFTVMNNKIYFRSDDGVHGSELWVSDGTLSGTQMVIDIAPGIQGSTPDGMVTDGNKLYFSAYDGQTHQVEPWISDGTASGTVLLKDINPAGSSNPETFIPFNGKVVFAADDGSTGREMWLTDGTTSGTVLLKDITPGFSGGCSIPFSAVNNILLFFPGCDGSSNGPDLWVSDLTSANTIKIAPPNSTTSATLMNANSFGVFNNELYVGAMFDTSGIELWKVSGSFTGLSPKTIGRLNIYPNPATNQINVLGLKTGEWIQVYNMQGQLVLTHQVENAALSISTENWTSGLYLLKSSSQSSLISIQKH
jgi:ELWxxDGT repeat protein